MLREAAGRVTIIAATAAMLAAEDEGGAAIADMLGVGAPTAWPPENNDAETRAWFATMLTDHPHAPGYAAWYIVGDGRLCGTCGYTGPPDASGAVEIGYSVLPSDQRRGYATVAVRLLVARAFRDDAVTAVVAETLPSLPPSQGVLLKCGFVRTSERIDEDGGEVWRYELPRAAYLRSMRDPLA